MKITSRGIIFDGKKILVIQHKAGSMYCLPGGTLERFEKIEDCVARELQEELGIKAVVGNLLYIHQAINNENKLHILEFFYEIKNVSDYLNIDLSN